MVGGYPHGFFRFVRSTKDGRGIYVDFDGVIHIEFSKKYWATIDKYRNNITDLAVDHKTGDIYIIDSYGNSQKADVPYLEKIQLENGRSST